MLNVALYYRSPKVQIGIIVYRIFSHLIVHLTGHKATSISAGDERGVMLPRHLPLLLHCAAAANKPSIVATAHAAGNQNHPSPISPPNLISQATFGWLGETLKRGADHPLTADELPPLQARDSARIVTDTLEKHWSALLTSKVSQSASGHGTILLAMWRSFGVEFGVAGLVKLASDLCQVASPLLLKRIIGMLEAGADLRMGLKPSLALLGLSALQAFCLRHYFAQVFRTGLRLRAAVVGIAYRKMLRLSPTARIASSSGEITNLMGSDAARFADLIPYLHALWFAPLQVVAAIFLLWQEIGPSVFPGLAVIFAVLHINKRIAAATFRLQQKLLKLRDERAKLVRETLSGIKVIKLHAWELAFATRIQASRGAELAAMRTVTWLRAILSALFTCTPSIVAVAMLGAHALAGRDLTLKTAMTVLSAVSLLRSPLVFLPLVLQNVQEANLSLGRLSRFLNAEEYQPTSAGDLSGVGVAVDGGTFEWGGVDPQSDGGVVSIAAPASETPSQKHASHSQHSSTQGNGPAESSTAPLLPQQHLHAHPHPLSELAEAEEEVSGSHQAAAAHDAHRAHGADDAAEHGLVEREGGARERFVLRSVDMRASAGELVALVGAVGAGKSSFLSALLGDMPCVGGSVALRGRCAYTAQTPFILGASVRDNILFDQPYDHERYERVLRACQLMPDLSLLPERDFTLIGDRGVFLSGGQRARVALARAVYADAEVYLLDDPLAACDSRVAAALMEEVIGPNGLLKEKLRILSTSNLESLGGADQIHVLRNGEVQESGTYEELARTDGAFSRLLQLMQEERVHSATSSDAGHGRHEGEGDEDEAGDDGASGGDKPQLVEVQSGVAEGEQMADEDVDDARVGRVELSVLWTWVRAAGGTRAAAIAMLPLVLAEMTTLGSQFWLTRWASGSGMRQLPQLGGYALWSLVAAAAIVVRSRLVLGLGLAAGARLHDSLLARVIRAPLAFFDLTPRGRLLNRFSKELNTVDVALPSALQTYASTLASVATTLTVVCASSPPFALFLVPIASAYLALQKYYSSSSREIKRIESSARAPVVTHIASSLDGLSTIRAFDAGRKFVKQSEATVDASLRSSLTSALINCWLGLRLEMLGAFIAAFAALMAFARNAPVGPPVAAVGASGWLLSKLRGSGGVGTAALAVTLAVQVTQTLNWTVRQAVEVESHLIAVERLKSYDGLAPEPGYTAEQLKPLLDAIAESEHAQAGGKQLPLDRLQEAANAEAGEVAPAPTVAESLGEVAHPHSGEHGFSGHAGLGTEVHGAEARVLETGVGEYAPHGRVELRDLRLKYREGLPDVLHGLTATVLPGEKVGVVGRTGSGKSSLVVALTRLVAPPLRTGAILIDGRDIAEVPLHVHRSAVAVIPQEPVLFSGTVRDNLDPLGEHTAQAMWAALQRVHLAHAVRSLDDEVAEDGANFSTGQRQLLCIARALLSRCSLVIMDEATSAVDAETDALIQRTIRSAFADATVITIAHRLNTVLDADKIMVLEKGELAEYGSPRDLMAKPRGIFREMVHASRYL